MENGFKKAMESGSRTALPLRPLAITVDSTVTTRCETGRQKKSEMELHIREENLDLEDGTDASSTYSREDPKLDSIV